MATGFRRFLHSIANELTEKDLKSLKFLCLDKIGHGNSENINDSLDFLQWLEKQDKLSEGNTKELEELLEIADRRDLARKVEDYRESVGKRHDDTPTISGTLYQQESSPIQTSDTDPSNSSVSIESPIPFDSVGSLSASHSDAVSLKRVNSPHHLVNHTADKLVTADLLSHQRLDESGPGSVADSQKLESSHLPGHVTADAVERLEGFQALVARSYQTELRNYVIKSGNSIIYAPFGSGKTLVAALVAESLLKSYEYPEQYRVLFVVAEVSLIDRKKAVMEEWLKPRLSFLKTAGISGQIGATHPLDEQIKDCHLIVLTAGVLHNHLVGIGDFAPIPWSSIHLLILDECYNTRSKHHYNKIMQHYMTAKTRSHRLPFVLGLTSFIPTKAKVNLDKAVEHIVRLCANLDTNTILQVKQNVAELMAFVKAPSNAIYTLPSISADAFQVTISRVMKSLEGKVLGENTPSGSVHYGTLEYHNWLSRKWHENDPKRFSIEFLMQLNQALIINRDATTRDATHCLQKYLADTNKCKLNSSQEPLFDKIQKYLETLEQPCRSSRLDQLREVLVRIYQKTPEARTILFTRTPFSTRFLVNWLHLEADLQFLKPISANDSAASEENAHKVNKLIGESKLLVCSCTTSLQGLTLTKYDIVVRYGVIEDEISVVHVDQDHGNKRQEAERGSVHILEGGQREAVHVDKYRVSEEALARFCGMSERRRTRAIQIARRREDEKQSKRLESSTSLNLSRLHLYCKNCKQYLCRGDSVKKLKGMHKVVPSPDFEKCAIWSKSRSARKKTELGQSPAVDGVTFVGQVSCRACRHPLGSVMQTDEERLPGIKFDSLLYTYAESEASPDDIKKDFSKGMKTSFVDSIGDLYGS